MRLAIIFAGCSLATLALANNAAAQSSTESFTYDALGRLIKVEVTGGSEDGTERDYDYDDASNRTLVTASSGSAPPPSPPPPPPPSSPTVLTDSNLDVLTAHQSTYDCGETNIPAFGILWKHCTLDAGGANVYFYDGSTSTFATGYAMPSQFTLEVDPAYYGTAQ